ncbi:aminoacyl-tRNA hydrolase [Rickettsiales bacterium]|nr:aminoacyl-tRNA hydrolase [Rickettsiales bacterium]
MFLIVGLGNPGTQYDNTRHNVGFMAVDEIVHRFSFLGPKEKNRAQIYEGKIGDHKIIAIKPMTFMNLSGTSVAEIVRFYKIPIENVIVFHDELDLPFKKIRVKIGGGAGGHNGIKDIDARIGKDYKRVRIGIDHPGDKDKVSGYVLKPFSKDEQKELPFLLQDIADNVELLIKGDDSLFMTKMVKN